jgi:hypothetical protein
MNMSTYKNDVFRLTTMTNMQLSCSGILVNRFY